jgi:hypothetical protein
MLSMRWFVNAAFLSLVACGGESQHHTGIDALLPDTNGNIDGLGDGCNYVEQRDATNDDVFPAPGTPEATGLTIGSMTTICGAFEHTHHDSDITVDVDGYTASVGSETDVLVRIAGAGSEAIELVGVDVYTGAAFDQLVGQVTFYGDHGVTSVHLAAGTYEFVPFALHSQAIAATVPYTLQLATDSLDTRCAPITTGGYTEANDGGTNTGNDVVGFPASGPPALTTLGTDNPEPSGITTSPSSMNRISGSAADITVPDKYEDKDTYAFATGAANELTVRLAWSGAANLDFFIFEAGNATPIWRADATTAGAETEMFSLKPSSNYWLLVGAKPGAGLPATYSATLCGANY